jgi:hypothetical protein
VGATPGQRLLTILLVLSGLYDILYAGLSPLPPLSELPVPPVWWAISVTTLVAAFGVLRTAHWGRLLAIVVVTFWLVYPIWSEAYWMRGTDLLRWLAQPLWLSLVISVGVSSLALWWLVKRWPSPGRAAV